MAAFNRRRASVSPVKILLYEQPIPNYEQRQWLLTFNDLYVDAEDNKRKLSLFSLHWLRYVNVLLAPYGLSIVKRPLADNTAIFSWEYLEKFYIVGALSKMNGKNWGREYMAAKENWSYWRGLNE